MIKFIKNFNFDDFKAKLDFGFFVLISILLTPVAFIYNKRKERYTHKGPGDVEVVFNDDLDLDDIDNTYLNSVEYFSYKNRIKDSFDKFMLNHNVSIDDKSVQLLEDATIDLVYKKKNFLGLDSKFYRTRKYSLCLVIDGFKDGDNLINVISPLLKDYGEYLGDFLYTYYVESKDDSGKIVIGVKTIKESYLADRYLDDCYEWYKQKSW